MPSTPTKKLVGGGYVGDEDPQAQAVTLLPRGWQDRAGAQFSGPQSLLFRLSQETTDVAFESCQRKLQNYTIAGVTRHTKTTPGGSHLGM